MPNTRATQDMVSYLARNPIFYVVLPPDNPANPTDRYLVAEFADWYSYVLGTHDDFAYVSFSQYSMARMMADALTEDPSSRLSVPHWEVHDR